MRKRFFLCSLAFALMILTAVVVHVVGVFRLLKAISRSTHPISVQSPLAAAILRRDVVGVDTLLNRGEDPNVRYAPNSSWPDASQVSPLPQGPTPLMIAALGGNTGNYWNWYNYPGMGSPTARPGQFDQPPIVQTLLTHGADPNVRDEHGWTPLLCASVCGNSNIVRYLLDHRADVNEKLQGNETVLMDVARRADVSLVKLFLLKGAQVNSQDQWGTSALVAACDADAGVYSSERFSLRGNAAIVQLLLEHGANVNLPCSGPHPSALMTAVYNRNPGVVQLLLSHGAHVNATNSDGLTALMLVPRIFSWRDLAILNMLAANGARINAASYDGNTALLWAADKGDLGTVQF